MIQVRESYQVRFGRIDQAVDYWSRLPREVAAWPGRGAVIVRSCFRALEWRAAEALDLVRIYGALLVDQGVGRHPRLLGDLSGRLFNVVIEIETSNLKDWDDHRR